MNYIKMFLIIMLPLLGLLLITDLALVLEQDKFLFRVGAGVIVTFAALVSGIAALENKA